MAGTERRALRSGFRTGGQDEGPPRRNVRKVDGSFLRAGRANSTTRTDPRIAIPLFAGGSGAWSSDFGESAGGICGFVGTVGGSGPMSEEVRPIVRGPLR